MQKNRFVIQVPPDCLFSAVELDKIKKARWGVEANKIVRHVSTVPGYGTRAMQRVLTPGDFLVFVESVLDELHMYAWNLHIMHEDQYKEWLKYE